MTLAPFDPTALLDVLSRHRVSFVAIGGWAAGVLGVVWSTLDLDVVIDPTGPMLFRTKHGRLDVLKEAGGETFATLSSDASTTIVAGHSVSVANLASILRMKRAANRPKDRKVLAAIEAALGAKKPEEP